MDSLSHLIYASTAASKMGQPELRAILESARIVNAQLDVTGILLHSEGSFFQVLEGDVEVIESLYAKIGRDRRHKNAVLIVREPIPNRSFADWSMGFASVTSKDVAGIIGANDFFQQNRVSISLVRVAQKSFWQVSLMAGGGGCLPGRPRGFAALDAAELLVTVSAPQPSPTATCRSSGSNTARSRSSSVVRRAPIRPRIMWVKR